MLLRNVEPPELCNSTRLIIKKIETLILTTTILIGPSAGLTKLLTPMSVSHSAVPFGFTRRQFPLKVCFAMSINKAQGQSLQVVGLNLRATVNYTSDAPVSAVHTIRATPGTLSTKTLCSNTFEPTTFTLPSLESL
uniref:ATP-dependent DNA helicase n=1 Tax=Octopus bimaculoides TaxID=37653 RepID=A0A0L8IGU8_OCTBM